MAPRPAPAGPAEPAPPSAPAPGVTPAEPPGRAAERAEPPSEPLEEAAEPAEPQVPTGELAEAPVDVAQGAEADTAEPAPAGTERQPEAEAGPRPPAGAEAGARAPAEGEPPPGPPAAGGPGEAEAVTEAVVEGTAAAPAAPQITAADPAGILAQLAQTPPSTAALALDQAEQASDAALADQRQQAEQGLPELPAPTGLPPVPAPPPGEPAAEPRVAPKEPAGAPATGSKATGSKAGGAQAEGGPAGTAVPEAPPMPPPRPTFLPGPESGASEEEQARTAAKARQALESVGMDTEQVPTLLGPRPKVQPSEETDPGQLDAARGSADAQVAEAKAAAAAGIDADHGLGTIYPAPTDERLSARRPLAGSGRPPAAGGGPALPAPADLAAGLDQSLGPGFRARLGDEQDQYAAGQQKFEEDSAQAHRDTDAEIGKLTARTADTQRAERRKAGADVAAYQQQWRAELDAKEQDYAKKAGAAAKEQRGKIDAKKAEAERKAAAEFDKAEHKAAEETHKAERKAEAEKKRKREDSGGFFGWVKRKAAAFVDMLKKAINAIWDALRSVVKGLFDLAKKLAMAIIDAVRSVIVGLIKAFGAILKGIVSLVLVAFPETAKKINARIDAAVDFAVEKVNAAADKLKGAVAAALDFLANTIDKLLGLVQSLYNGILTVLGMLIRGELKELIMRLGNVVTAAKGSPAKFETAAYEELLGGDFDQPLSPMELLQAGEKPMELPEPPGPAGSPAPAGRQPAPAPGDAAGLPRRPWTEDNVGVDEVVTSAQLSPEARAEVGEFLTTDGELTIGQSASPDRSVDAIVAEATGGNQAPRADEAPGEQAVDEAKLPPDGLTPRRRAEIRWKLMKQGLAKWFEDNKVAIIAGAVAAILALAALIFFSGGTILAAIGPIMSVLGPLFIGATVATIAGYVQDFVTKAWDGNTDGGAKSLAKALAAGAVELISAITFKAGGAALRGAKAAAKAGFRLVKTAAVATGKFIAKGFRFIISKGKVLLQGARGFVTRQFKRLRDLGEALLSRLRFKKFRILIRGRRFTLQGWINPWYDIIDGELVEVSKKTKGAVELDELTEARIKAGGKPSKGDVRPGETVPYKEAKAVEGRGKVGDNLEGDHVPSWGAILAEAENAKGRPLNPDELRKLKNEAVTVVLEKQTHKTISRTHGPKNKVLIAADAKDLTKAFHKDVEAILEGLRKDNKLTKEWVGSYMKAYQMNIKLGRVASNKETTAMLLKYAKLAT
jgi:hypothetical protein